MKKIAFFVEGQTEQIFVNRLVKEVLGYGNATIILKKITGGTNAPRHEFVRNLNISRNAEFMVLVYDCGADNRVKSEILENMQSLRSNGYTCVVGLRDLYPLPVDEYTRLAKGLNFLPLDMKEFKSIFDIIVVIQEIETWFLAEASHFLKVDKKLTGRYIKQHLGFDPNVVNLVTRDHPSEDLNRIYKLAGRAYTKKYWQVEKLVNRLDFNKIRRDIRHKIPSLDELISCLEDFKKGKR